MTELAANSLIGAMPRMGAAQFHVKPLPHDSGCMRELAGRRLARTFA